MIELPRRNITRFFIPMVDVMMLMFSMFLLMPFMEGGSTSGENPADLTRNELIAKNKRLQNQVADSTSTVKQLIEEIRKLRPYAASSIDLEEIKKEFELIQQAKIDVLKKRLYLKVAVFDPHRENLVFYDKAPPEKEEEYDDYVATLIEQHEKEASARGQDLFYILLVPPQGPTMNQMRRYRQWFSKVPYQILVTPD